MKDVECTETNEKLIFRFWWFLVFEIWSFFHSKLAIFDEFSLTQKNKNRKNLIYDFLFNSALWATVMKFLSSSEGGGGLHILPWDPANIQSQIFSLTFFFDNFWFRMHTDYKIIDKKIFSRRKTAYLVSDFQRIVHLPQVFIIFVLRSSIISGQGG